MHVQVNRDLWREARIDMCSAAPAGTSRCCRSVRRAGAGLQPRVPRGVPPRLHLRNWLERPSWRIARGWPDLIGSSEGGSNPILARPPSGGHRRAQAAVLQSATLSRTMPSPGLGSGLCVTSLHASTSPPGPSRSCCWPRRRRPRRVGRGRPARPRRRLNVSPRPRRRLRRDRAPLRPRAEPPPPTRSTTCSSAAPETAGPPCALDAGGA